MRGSPRFHARSKLFLSNNDTVLKPKSKFLKGQISGSSRFDAWSTLLFYFNQNQTYLDEILRPSGCTQTEDVLLFGVVIGNVHHGGLDADWSVLGGGGARVGISPLLHQVQGLVLEHHPDWLPGTVTGTLKGTKYNV